MTPAETPEEARRFFKFRLEYVQEHSQYGFTSTHRQMLESAIAAYGANLAPEQLEEANRLLARHPATSAATR